MRLPRFFAPDASASDTLVDLPEEEARHLTRVLRLTTGAEVRVFNGRGGEWTATVQHASRQRVTLRLESPAVSIGEPRVAITLALAVLKGDKTDDAIRDAVMLGVKAIRPVLTARSETSLAAIGRGGRLERWHRIAIASAKQCGRAVVPEVLAPRHTEDVLAEGGCVVMLVEPDVVTVSARLGDLPRTDRATVLIGPEGGWSPDEVQRAVASGAFVVTLGTQTIRADAMPIVGLTALRVHWGDFDGPSQKPES